MKANPPVDFALVDPHERYRQLNAKFFDGRLHAHVPITFAPLKRASGETRIQIIAVPPYNIAEVKSRARFLPIGPDMARILISGITLSSLIKYDESEFDLVLLHEMCHVAVAQMGWPWEHHGHNFAAEAQRVGRLAGVRIPLTHEAKGEVDGKARDVGIFLATNRVGDKAFCLFSPKALPDFVEKAKTDSLTYGNVKVFVARTKLWARFPVKRIPERYGFRLWKWKPEFDAELAGGRLEFEVSFDEEAMERRRRERDEQRAASRRAAGNPSKARHVYVGTLLNPVDHKPYAVTWDPDVKHCYIVTPASGPFIGKVWGDGYFEDDPGDEMGASAKSGCPRSHTPAGVKKKGAGLGLMLYSGLAMVAAFSHENLHRRKSLRLPNVKGTCISSYPEARSEAASKWWDAQAERGFTTKETIEVEGTEECDSDSYDIDVDNDVLGIDEVDVRRRASRSHSGVNHIKDFSVSGTATVEYEYCSGAEDQSIEIDRLEFSSVVEAGLVIHVNEDLSELHTKLPPLKLFKEIDLSDVRDFGFFKLVEDAYIRIAADEQDGTTPDDFRRFLQRSVPFWAHSKDEVREREAGAFSGYARNPGAEHSKAWLAQYGKLIEAEAEAGL